MSHLVCAEIPDHPLTATQINLFRDIRALYGGISASLANSSGIFVSDTTHCDLVRPGAALYGVNPTPGRDNPMQGVVELTGRILQIRGVVANETVGYGATWTAKRASRIIVVALGYADGLLRSASAGDDKPGGTAIVADTPCPIVGRISMDLVCVDVTDLPNGAVHRGGLATFIGSGIGIDDFATAAGTIGYEVLTRLGMRCHVVYRGA
jgi:alanine racemase